MTLNGRFAVRQSRKGVLCDHMVHFSTDLTLWLDCPAMMTRLYLVWSSRNMRVKSVTCNLEIMRLHPVRAGLSFTRDEFFFPGAICYRQQETACL